MSADTSNITLILKPNMAIESDFKDPEAAEDFKVRSFIRMVKNVAKVIADANVVLV